MNRFLIKFNDYITECYEFIIIHSKYCEKKYDILGKRELENIDPFKPSIIEINYPAEIMIFKL